MAGLCEGGNEPPGSLKATNVCRGTMLSCHANPRRGVGHLGGGRWKGQAVRIPNSQSTMPRGPNVNISSDVRPDYSAVQRRRF
ncbi:hypothetical protein ANN_11667 [Periplaneta americana]|uniref:Uncharacterized protein n=1 Tax=Periplaneta americana TaxID=6978 RepID=A0ABQ8T5N6_PERAM|nr:hypothetical protein ANN_11667 [Periplaneta americana]